MSTPVDTYVMGSGDVEYPAYVGNKVSTVIVSAASGTSSQTLLAGAPGYYITRFYVTVDPICTTSPSGMVEVTATDSVLGIIGRTRVFMPNNFSAAGLDATPSLVTTSDSGFFFISPNANSTVTVQVTQALTGAGVVRVTANWGTTHQLGV